MAKRSNPSFDRFLAKAQSGGTMLEYGEAKIRVLNMPVSESRRYSKMHEESQAEDGDPNAFIDALAEVFLEYGRDGETGEKFDGSRSDVIESVPQGLLFRVFQAAATPDIKGAVKN